MKHLFCALLLFLMVATLIFAFLHTSVSFGETASASSLFCNTHGHLSLRLVLPFALEKVCKPIKEGWKNLPPAVTLLPSLLWENTVGLLAEVRSAYEGEICGCVTLG